MGPVFFKVSKTPFDYTMLRMLVCVVADDEVQSMNSHAWAFLHNNQDEREKGVSLVKRSLN